MPKKPDFSSETSVTRVVAGSYIEYHRDFAGSEEEDLRQTTATLDECRIVNRTEAIELPCGLGFRLTWFRGIHASGGVP